MILFIILFLGCRPESGVYRQAPLKEELMPDNAMLIRYLEEQMEEYPEEEDSYIKLAEIYRGQGNDEKALDILKKGQRYIPENPDLLIKLAWLYLDAKNKDDLSATLKTLREIAPDNMEFLKLSSGYSLLLNDYNNALFFANRAILTNQYDDEGYFLRGQAYLLNNDSLTAMESFEEAWQLKRSMNNFAGALDLSLALGQHVRAARYLSEAKRANPHEQFCYYDGKFLNETKQLDSARAVLKRCLEIDPGDKRVEFELAKNHSRSNNPDSAVVFLDKYLNSSPDDIGALLFKAKLLDRQANYTVALEYYQKVMAIDSTSSIAAAGVRNVKRKLARVRALRRKENVKKQAEEFRTIKTKPVL